MRYKKTFFKLLINQNKMKFLLTGQETERLIFRLLTPDDFDNWLELFKDTSVGRFLGMESIPTSEGQCKKWFELSENRYKNDLGGMNVLIDKTTGELVGQCGLLVQELDDQEEIEIGYSVLPKFQNKGYASEAAQKCRDYAFTNNIVDSLISIIHIENISSEKVALKNGMKKSKQTIFKEMPVNVFRIERSEWEQLKKKK